MLNGRGGMARKQSAYCGRGSSRGSVPSGTVQLYIIHILSFNEKRLVKGDWLLDSLILLAQCFIERMNKKEIISFFY